jgi:hypothetical protein
MFMSEFSEVSERGRRRKTSGRRVRKKKPKKEYKEPVKAVKPKRIRRAKKPAGFRRYHGTRTLVDRSAEKSLRAAIIEKARAGLTTIDAEKFIKSISIEQATDIASAVLFCVSVYKNPGAAGNIESIVKKFLRFKFEEYVLNHDRTLILAQFVGISRERLLSQLDRYSRATGIELLNEFGEIDW